jgi:hypothetical protein
VIEVNKKKKKLMLYMISKINDLVLVGKEDYLEMQYKLISEYNEGIYREKKAKEIIRRKLSCHKK